MFTLSSSWAFAGAWLQAGFALGAWMLIIAKLRQFHRSSTANREYLLEFCRAPDWHAAAEIPCNGCGYARVAGVGFGVLRHAPAAGEALRPGALLERNLQRQALWECCALERGLAFLACLGEIAYVVGLSCPIDEPVAAVGLALAVVLPAAAGFLYLRRRVKSMRAGLDDFIGDFLELAARSKPQTRCEVRASFSERPRHAARRLHAVNS